MLPIQFLSLAVPYLWHQVVALSAMLWYEVAVIMYALLFDSTPFIPDAALPAAEQDPESTMESRSWTTRVQDSVQRLYLFPKQHGEELQ